MGTGGDDLGAANAETAAAGGRRRAANRSSHTPTAAPSCCSVQEFYRASLQLVQGTMGALPQGYLLLMRKAEDGAIEDGERALVLAVGGDTLQGVAMLMQGQASERPLSLDLLWAILERGQVRGGCGEWGWHARVGLVLSSSTPQPHAPPPPHPGKKQDPVAGAARGDCGAARQHLHWAPVFWRRRQRARRVGHRLPPL